MKPIKFSASLGAILNENCNLELKHQLINAFINLDITGLEKLIAEDNNFENKDKWTFCVSIETNFRDIKI